MAGSANPGSGGAVNPSLLSSAAQIMAARTDLMRAVYGGTETMRAKEKDFLPQYERETDTRYKARLASTFALNKLKEAVEAASAKPFRTLMKVNNTDANLDLWIKDIDLIGNHIHHFAHKLFNNGLLDGQCHYFVDHPSTVQFKNLAEQKAAGVRPYFRLVRTQDLLAAYNDYVGGDVQCVHARIKSQRIERTVDYKEIIWNQIYVIEKEPGKDSGVVQVYEQQAGQGGGDWARVSEVQIPSLLEVPLVTLYAGEREGDYVSRSIFQDLAYKQIEHWISSSDQRSILAASRFPMLAASGVQIDDDVEGQTFEIGPYKLLFTPDAQGRWYYVEPTGKAVESGFKDLAQLEMHMDMMALNPVVSTHRQYVPQNERDIAETRVHSVVHDLALSCKDAIERGLKFFSIWGGPDYSAVTVDLNVDFSNTADKLKEIAELIKAYEKKGISRQTLLAEMRRRDLLGDDFDLNAELALMLADDQFNADLSVAGKEGASAPKAPDQSAPDDGEDPPVDFPKGQTRPTRQI